MGIAQTAKDLVRKALLSISSYSEQQTPSGPHAETVERIRESLGGNIIPLPQTQTRWYLSQLEEIIHTADVGDMGGVGRLCRSLRRDGFLSGLLSTRTDGLVRLPKRFYGSPEQVAELEPRNGTRSLFDEMCPPSELSLLAGDGILCGVGVAELVPVEGRDYPVLVRLDPEFLTYRWVEGRWYYRSVAGLLPITPGDGRWVLHIPGGRMAPWQNGAWMALGRAYIIKDHAIQYRANYSSKLAHPARAAIAPVGASEEERDGFLQSLISWGVNSVFSLPVGWDIKLVEANGRGYEVFRQEVDNSNMEFMIALAGQVVTTTGGTGFANADIHKSIRADLIKATADGLAYTINTQIIPQWVAHRYGLESLEERAIVEWDVTPPKDRQAEAASLNSVAQAIVQLGAALQPYGLSADIKSLSVQYGIPITGDIDGDGVPDFEGTTAEATSAPETIKESNVI